MRKASWRIGLTVLVMTALCGAGASLAYASGSSSGRGLATVTGSIQDNQGRPLAGAVISLLREGAEEVIRQTRSDAGGRFTVRVSPGRYSLRAVAEGFVAASFPAATLSSASELVYRFNLEPVGSGRTLPERRADRNDPRWRVRATHNRRSIFNLEDGDDPTLTAAAEEEEVVELDADLRPILPRHSFSYQPHGVVETYFAASENPFATSYLGTNVAVLMPVDENVNLILAGQTGIGAGAPQRAELTARVRAGARHRLSATVAGASLPLFTAASGGKAGGRLGQFSLRAIDEWVVRDGIVVVVGLDYSRFIGTNGASAFSPRLGLQFDANARTRIRAAYAPGGDGARVQSVANFEGGPVVFRDMGAQPVAYVDGRAVMERSRRMELGVERVLDGQSRVEATAFFDTTTGRGVGLMRLPINSLSSADNAALLSIANQEGAARGLRVVYTRRISSALTASAGYSFGQGQELSPEGLTEPHRIFRRGYFQTAAAQLEASLGEGTHITTVFRFSPGATVLAIDPFAGRLAVYDPSLSILITQELPTFGLPFRAEAVLDARNLFDTQSSVDDGETMTALGMMRRMVRGGISVRF